MKIAIIGYGKMGMAVERLAVERGHTVQIVKQLDQAALLPEGISCAIEFTHAGAAPVIIRRCLDSGRPIVSGTTGWDADRQDVCAYCIEKKGAFLWSPNFSAGMHIVFEINKVLASMMDRRPEYDVEILETHHTEKKDKPSGTAIVIANQIINVLRRKTQWELKEHEVLNDETLAITSERLQDVKGIHRITYKGPYDIISLRHKALSRDAFAHGAVISAEWLVGKTGVFTFNDVLGTDMK
ncbi:MAG TPA: 4-hydroxy-tetrahydrodipicolinate reductase [Saprospiraceae bacterium]|nr:4-hydroxy-tetrahydrodipicolinate reductase [Saprospiraceae bacterium]